MASATMAPATEDTPAQLPNHKVKYKKAYQRACNEKDDKGQNLRRTSEALVLPD